MIGIRVHFFHQNNRKAKNIGFYIKREGRKDKVKINQSDSQ